MGAPAGMNEESGGIIEWPGTIGCPYEMV